MSDNTYIDEILKYKEHRKGAAIAILCNPASREKFNDERIKDIPVYENVTQDISGYIMGDENDIIEISKATI